MSIRLLWIYILALAGAVLLIGLLFVDDIKLTPYYIFGFVGVFTGRWDFHCWTNRIDDEGIIEGLNPFKRVPRWPVLVLVLLVFTILEKLSPLLYIALLLHLVTVAISIGTLEKRLNKKIGIRLSGRISIQNLLLAPVIYMIVILVISSFADSFYSENYLFKFKVVSATGEPVSDATIDTKASIYRHGEEYLYFGIYAVEEKQGEYQAYFQYRRRQSPFFVLKLFSPKPVPDKIFLTLGKEGFQKRSLIYSRKELMEKYVLEKEERESGNFNRYVFLLPDICLEAVPQG